MPSKIITLEKPITGHRPCRTLEFREPCWDDYCSIGDPYVWARSPQDPNYLEAVPMPERVRDYAERLIVEGDKAGDPLLLSQLGLRDSKQVEGAICGFFLAVDPKTILGSTASSKTSSSSSNGDQTSSDA